MKDYSLNKKHAKNYIKDFRTIKTEAGECYELIFADGAVFKDVVANEENFRKLERVQETQAKHGVENKQRFINRRTLSGVVTGLSAAASCAVGCVATTAAMNVGLIGQEPLTLTLAKGVITIIGTIPAFTKLVQNCGKVKELEKIEYRDAHKDKLGQIDRYANSLVGVSAKTRRLLEDQDEPNPFSILNIDRFTQKDMETIIENMAREEKTGLQYTYTK